MKSVFRFSLLLVLPCVLAWGEMADPAPVESGDSEETGGVSIPDPPSSDVFESRLDDIERRLEGREQCDALLRAYEDRNRELADYLERYGGEVDPEVASSIRSEMGENEEERHFLETNRNNPELFERNTGEDDGEETEDETEETEPGEDEAFEGGEDGGDVGESDRQMAKDEGMTDNQINEERDALNYDEIDKAFDDGGKDEVFDEIDQTLSSGGKVEVGRSISAAGSVLSSVSGAFGKISGWKETDVELEKLVGRVGSGSLQKEIEAEPVVSAGGNASGGGGSSSGKNRGGSSYLLEDEDDDPPLTPEEVGAVARFLDEATYADFGWEFGGFDGSSAETYGTVIGGLQMSKDGLSFEYDYDLSSWGLEYTQYEKGPHGGAFACLFVLDNDGNWVGGKFDWISSSRQTRDFKNIYGTGPEGVYNGWDLSNVPKSTTAAFVIVSEDGKFRSNVITAHWDR